MFRSAECRDVNEARQCLASGSRAPRFSPALSAQFGRATEGGFFVRKTNILLLAVLCAATAAFAQRSPEPDAFSTEKEIKSFETVKVSLAEAIKVAANKHKDAKVVDVSFDSQAGQLAYKVKTYQGNNVWEGAVDAWTGKIIGEGTTTPVSKLDEEDQSELAGLQKASIDLSKATALAEEKGSGKAISAGLEETNGRVVYEVTIVNNGAATKYVVDPKNGQIK
jgi:uncharacterized membrane protein YkoI